MSNKYKQSGTAGLFSEEFRLEKLSRQGDPLERLNSVVDWSVFSPSLDKILNHDRLCNSGAKPYDPLLMFKILILQRYYNLSEYQIEYQILDRLSFCRFLGLTLNDKVPDEKTIWDFKNRLIAKGLEKELFKIFRDLLEKHGLIANEGKLIDASFVEMPRQRNSKKENDQIKSGNPPEDWDESPNKKRQKDVDARWTKKNNENHFGYKDHVKVDNKNKLIDNYVVTPANVHDSQALEELLSNNDEGQNLHADSAYTGEEQEAAMKKYKVNNCVHEKGYKNRPLTEKQKQSNTEKSKTRARVEHVFGFIEQSMNRFNLNCIGLKRTTGTIGLVNLTYNLFRYEQIVRLQGITMPSFE